MIQGLYIASMGMTPLMEKQDQIANNLANVQTTGYKQSGTFIKTFQKFLANDQREPFVNNEIKTDETYIDYSAGIMRKTDGPLDVFVQGSGFITAMTNSGMRYTRNGNLSLDSEGFVVTSDGSKVLGKEGYIKLDKRYQIKITESGEFFQEGMSKGSLRISEFPKPYKLAREGNGYFRPVALDAPVGDSTNFAVKQGFLETSNVDTIHNMVSMIASYRNYEADSKALQAQDETLDKAVNQVGKLG
jgi:flagellar basal-body rod protein FlgF